MAPTSEDRFDSSEASTPDDWPSKVYPGGQSDRIPSGGVRRCAHLTEDWKKVKDSPERRRMQNRNAQRRYRDKCKGRREGCEKLKCIEEKPKAAETNKRRRLYETQERSVSVTNDSSHAMGTMAFDSVNPQEVARSGDWTLFDLPIIEASEEQAIPGASGRPHVPGTMDVHEPCPFSPTATLSALPFQGLSNITDEINWEQWIHKCLLNDDSNSLFLDMADTRTYTNS